MQHKTIILFLIKVNEMLANFDNFKHFCSLFINSLKDNAKIMSATDSIQGQRNGEQI